MLCYLHFYLGNGMIVVKFTDVFIGIMLRKKIEKGVLPHIVIVDMYVIQKTKEFYSKANEYYFT